MYKYMYMYMYVHTFIPPKKYRLYLHSTKKKVDTFSTLIININSIDGTCTKCYERELPPL